MVITNNQANLHGTSVVVVPLSSNASTVYPFQSHLPLERTNLDYDSKAQVELLRSVSVSRVGQHLGQIPEDLMLELEDVLLPSSAAKSSMPSSTS